MVPDRAGSSLDAAQGICNFCTGRRSPRKRALRHRLRTDATRGQRNSIKVAYSYLPDRRFHCIRWPRTAASPATRTTAGVSLARIVSLLARS